MFVKAFVIALLCTCSSAVPAVERRASLSPSVPIYPRRSAADPSYSVAESDLRNAISIPSTFTYGKKPPVILVPGLGVPASLTYPHSYGKLLAGTSFADPLWINVPTSSLQDAQITAEYVAYAINYISASVSQNVSVLVWSEGSLNTQWALKYWPSTRAVVSDFIGLSADFHGTVLATVACPPAACDPAVFQQKYLSNFVATLRNGGGDSAYVPTTTIYSIADDIVQPQIGTAASAYLNDARKVGVANYELQAVCPGQPAGGLVLHQGVLYNGLAYALVVDALTHAGPASIARVDTATYCGLSLAPGLSSSDQIALDLSIAVAAVNVLAFPSKVAVEPAIKPYAS